jgi:Cys-rich four helix bundle protein (predicted Tat secretion target)
MKESTMNRREALQGAGVLALAALAGSAFADDHEQMQDHEHMHHHHDMTPNAKLIAAVGDCLEKGNVCIAHCLMLLADGKAEMGGCAKSVHQMLALCGALLQLSSLESSHAKALATIAAEACKECEDECKKHADEHEACKNCMNACKECHQQCESFAA